MASAARPYRIPELRWRQPLPGCCPALVERISSRRPASAACGIGLGRPRFRPIHSPQGQGISAAFGGPRLRWIELTFCSSSTLRGRATDLQARVGALDQNPLTDRHASARPARQGDFHAPILNHGIPIGINVSDFCLLHRARGLSLTRHGLTNSLCNLLRPHTGALANSRLSISWRASSLQVTDSTKNLVLLRPNSDTVTAAFWPGLCLTSINRSTFKTQYPSKDSLTFFVAAVNAVAWSGIISLLNASGNGTTPRTA